MGGDVGDCEGHAVVDWLLGDCGEEGGHERIRHTWRVRRGDGGQEMVYRLWWFGLLITRYDVWNV